MEVAKIYKNSSLEEILSIVGRNGHPWLAKRLASNDTGLTGGHQVGVYMPREFVKMALPEIVSETRRNPDVVFRTCYFPREDYEVRELRAVYYNSKLVPEEGKKNTRNEFRLTCWGGKDSPVQQHERTGCIWFFAVVRSSESLSALCWVTDSLEEEVVLESWLGTEVEPKRFYSSEPVQKPIGRGWDLPREWYVEFPKGAEIFEEVRRLCPSEAWRKPVDDLLLKRREIEFQIFEHLEHSHVFPMIQEGFPTIDAFVSMANSVTNRRKSRAGTSLELNLEAIFRDQKLSFETQKTTEGKKKPDFLFPSQAAYRDTQFNAKNLHMLAAKTCCKDRWRQVISEARRISPKHLFTLQEGVSGPQLQEMKDSGVQLVVPKPNKKKFPEDWRTRILDLTEFVECVRSGQA